MDGLAIEIEYADGILENRIPFFTRIIQYPDNKFWHLEFMTGKHAPVKFYRDIKSGDLRSVGDIKNILELNRHNFLIILGKAYWATRDPKYFKKWKDRIGVMPGYSEGFFRSEPFFCKFRLRTSPAIKPRNSIETNVPIGIDWHDGLTHAAH